MSYTFDWDPAKASANLKKHGVSFEEAVTVFADPLSLNMPDPLHSEDELRFLVLGMSTSHRQLVVAYAERESLVREKPQGANAMTTKKTKATTKVDRDRDTLQREYDFSKATPGVTARQFAEGSNVVVIDPDLQQLFPTSQAVNDALRGLASIAARASSTRSKKRSAFEWVKLTGGSLQQVAARRGFL